MSAGNATARNAIPLFTKEAAYKKLGLSYILGTRGCRKFKKMTLCTYISFFIH